MTGPEAREFLTAREPDTGTGSGRRPGLVPQPTRTPSAGCSSLNRFEGPDFRGRRRLFERLRWVKMGPRRPGPAGGGAGRALKDGRAQFRPTAGGRSSGARGDPAPRQVGPRRARPRAGVSWPAEVGS